MSAKVRWQNEQTILAATSHTSSWWRAFHQSCPDRHPWRAGYSRGGCSWGSPPPPGNSPSPVPPVLYACAHGHSHASSHCICACVCVRVHAQQYCNAWTTRMCNLVSPYKCTMKPTLVSMVSCRQQYLRCMKSLNHLIIKLADHWTDPISEIRTGGEKGEAGGEGCRRMGNCLLQSKKKSEARYPIH